MSEDTDKEVNWQDEDTVSNTAAEQSVGGSSPSTSAPSGDIKEKRKKKDIIEEHTIEMYEIKMPKYRLYLRKPNGTIRPDVSNAVMYTLMVHWPDLVRIIPSDRWVTEEEIALLVSTWENASPRKSITRNLDTIRKGIIELQEAGILLRED